MDDPIFYCPKCKIELSYETDRIVSCDKCGFVWETRLDLDFIFRPLKQRKWDGIEWV